MLLLQNEAIEASYDCLSQSITYCCCCCRIKCIRKGEEEGWGAYMERVGTYVEVRRGRRAGVLIHILLLLQKGWGALWRVLEYLFCSVIRTAAAAALVAIANQLV